MHFVQLLVVLFLSFQINFKFYGFDGFDPIENTQLSLIQLLRIPQMSSCESRLIIFDTFILIHGSLSCLVIQPWNSSLLAKQICGSIPSTACGLARSCTRDGAADLLREKAGVGCNPTWTFTSSARCPISKALPCWKIKGPQRTKASRARTAKANIAAAAEKKEDFSVSMFAMQWTCSRVRIGMEDIP